MNRELSAQDRKQLLNLLQRGKILQRVLIERSLSRKDSIDKASQEDGQQE